MADFGLVNDLKNTKVVFPFMGCDPKATCYYETNPQGRKQ